jgi:hypothetical protein
MTEGATSVTIDERELEDLFDGIDLAPAPATRRRTSTH